MIGSHLRRAVVIAVPSLSAIIAWYSLSAAQFPPFPTPAVIVCGDFSREDSFAHDVHTALRQTARALAGTGGVKLHVLALDDEGRAGTLSFQQRFLDLLAQHYVIALVSANKTDNMPPVLRLAETFRIATLIAVATNDRVLSSATKHALRLVPNDSEQARAIVAWAGQYARPLIVYNRSDYGMFLSRSISQQLEEVGRPVLRWAFDALPLRLTACGAGAEFEPDAIIYAGYFAELPDVLRWIRTNGLTVPLLLSDGCYDSTLPRLTPGLTGPLALSFPKDVFATGDSTQAGFGAYGHDSALIIAHARQEALENCVPRDRFIQSVRAVLSDRTLVPQGLVEKYELTATGENRRATFRVIPIPGPATSPRGRTGSTRSEGGT